MKTCRKCHRDKPLDQFYAHPDCKQGVRPECKACHAPYDPKRGKEKHQKRYRNPAYVATARERANAWCKANRSKAATNVREFYRRNPDKARLKLANRRAAKARAAVSWNNQFFMAEAYRLAVLRSKVTGVPWVVDHIIPLRGESVSGLHVHTNLQVIEKIANLRKGASCDI